MVPWFYDFHSQLLFFSFFFFFQNSGTTPPRGHACERSQTSSLRTPLPQGQDKSDPGSHFQCTGQLPGLGPLEPAGLVVPATLDLLINWLIWSCSCSLTIFPFRAPWKRLTALQIQTLVAEPSKLTSPPKFTPAFKNPLYLWASQLWRRQTPADLHQLKCRLISSAAALEFCSAAGEEII